VGGATGSLTTGGLGGTKFGVVCLEEAKKKQLAVGGKGRKGGGGFGKKWRAP